MSCNYENEKDGCCHNKVAPGYEYCKRCIMREIRICTCNKKFITGKPIIANLFDKEIYLIDPIPDFFFTHLTGNIYHILSCRGCKNTGEISIKENFDQALQAGIVSCVYQKVEEDGKTFYEYLSDALCPKFEETLEKNGIKVGDPEEIRLG
jgi:hypothetical protein